jgi:hypothetical protein
VANPANFKESNDTLSKPANMTHEECEPLCICRTCQPDGLPIVVSCWKVTAEELAEITKTGRIWLIVCGASMPPVQVSGLKPFST